MKRRRLRGQRVALRPQREGDRDAMAGWYDLAPGGRGREVLVATRVGDDEPVAVVHYRVQGPRLVFERVVEAPEARGLGYGLEAARMIEEEARRRGLAQRFESEIRLEEGLALYFWLRLGYRPRGWPSRKRGRIISAVRMVV